MIWCKKRVMKRPRFVSAVFLSSDSTQEYGDQGKRPSAHIAYTKLSCVVFSHAPSPLLFSEAIQAHSQIIKYHVGFYFSWSQTKSSKILTSILWLPPNNLIYSSFNQMLWEVLCIVNPIMAPFVFLFNVRLLRKLPYAYIAFLDPF